MRHNDMMKSQSKFISPKHIGYSENVTFEILRSQEDTQYNLQNVIKMQVVDLQLAMKIYRCSNLQKESGLEISTPNKMILEAKSLLERIKKEIQNINGESHFQEEGFYKAVTNLSNHTKDILDLGAITTKLALCLNDKNKNKQDIESIFNEIKDNLDSYKQQDMIFNTIKDYNFSFTEETFKEARVALKEIRDLLDEYANEAKKDFENRFNKDIINLSAQIIGVTHTPLLAHILVHKIGVSVAKQLCMLILVGTATGAFFIAVSLIWLLMDIFEFFLSKHKENQKIGVAYKVYGAIMSIYKRLEYPLVSLLNFGHIGAGNLITMQKENVFTYCLFPNDTRFYLSFLYPFLKNNVSSFEDISYKATLSLNRKEETNQDYIQNIFEKNNIDKDMCQKVNTQFSILSLEHLYKICHTDKDNNFTHSSSFQHLQNMLMKFDSFLFIKSSSFSSIIANDILMQSFTPSKQQNKPRIHKTALFLTNCLHNGLPEYKTQQYIKDKIYDNENTKENVLFLSAMYRVKKVIFVRELIENLTNLFQRLECYAYYNQTQQVHYLTQKLGKLIKEYHAGRVKYQRHDISSYSLDDKKLCAMNERDFCNFIYDLCQIFITEKHVEMFNKYMDNTFTRHYWYGNDKQKLLKAKADIQETFKSIMAIVLDVSKLFSHFNAYEIARLKEYQKEIEEEYKKQRDKIEKFFEIKSFESEINKQVAPNIFYQAQNTKKLCVALLDKYFNNKMNANEDLESLLKQAKERIQKEQSKAEQSLQTNHKSAYHQITIEYVISLLPLNESFLNCLEEKDRFLFCRLIICEISEFAKSANSNIAYDFLANYEVTIDLYALINLKDKEFEELLHQNGVKEVVEAFYEIFMDSNKDASKNELKERLKKIGDEYGIASVTAFRDSSMKDKIKDVSLKIAEKLDEKYFNLPDVKISKGTFLLAAVANSVISYLCNVILDKIFPVQIDSIKDMKQQAIVLIFALNRHTNTPYATCRQGSEYLTFPIEITQTLVNADLQALIIGGSILNSGLFMHTPSVALFNENQENATRILKENIRHFINSKANINKIGKKGGEIVKEAYAKLWFYLDMGENQALESYLRNELQVKSSYYRLENLTSDKYIQTKLKKAKELDNSNENFVEVEGNKNGGIKFNQDFLIQLKRVAEWNYRVYEEKEVLPELQQDYEENDDSSIKDTSPDEWLCGNLIYDEDFIPTTIDIMD